MKAVNSLKHPVWPVMAILVATLAGLLLALYGQGWQDDLAYLLLSLPLMLSIRVIWLSFKPVTGNRNPPV